jgi:hypothetical protein
MFIHCNIDVRLGKIQYFINGPEMHRWHHSDDGGREFQNNYSTKLAIWDWIFGTAFLPDPKVRKPRLYGLSDTPDYPLSLDGVDDPTSIKSYFKVMWHDTVSYVKQHAFAFRKFRKD